MEHLWIILIAVLLFFVLGILFIISRRKMSSPTDGIQITQATVPSVPEPPALINEEDFQSIIHIEQLPITTVLDEKKLFKISDKTVIARISQTLPVSANLAANTTMQNFTQALNEQNIYKAIIPSGAHLVKPTKNGIQYGFFDSSAKSGHVVWEKVDLTKMQRVQSFQLGMANVMTVASMVVGQYYMSVINSKLENMTKNIEKIGDFQEKEFQSRILSLTTSVEEVSQFSAEILEDNDQGRDKLDTLENLKKTTTELLGQVNLTINALNNTNPKPKYKEYLSIVDDFQKLSVYQEVLVNALAEISKLIYLLGKGVISIEHSHYSFKKYLGMSSATRVSLCEWHDNQNKKFGINVDLEWKKRSGLKKIVMQPGIYFDDKKMFEDVPKSLVHKIKHQTKELPVWDSEAKDFYNEPVVIVIKDGQYYYLTEPDDSD